MTTIARGISPQSLLASLRREHPRVIATAEDFDRIRRSLSDDTSLRGMVDAVRERARQILDEPVATHDIPDGRRLLWVSRRTVDRVYHLGLMHRLEGGQTYRDRLWAELEAVAAFPDWNPSHFLDTGEMAHAVAVGYDWLFDAWTDAQRQVMCDAIVRHAFAPAKQVYPQAHGWHVADNNWNEVCNGGLGTAALALADVVPDDAALVLQQAVANLPRSLRHFEPDGGWCEGVGYWGYTMRYLSVFLASLDAALGHDFGLGQIPGLATAGLFPLHLTAPTGGVFNYADCSESIHFGDGVQAAYMLFLAQRYDRNDVLWGTDPTVGAHPLGVLWWRGREAQMPPRDAHFRGVECVTFRSDWNDPEGWYLAMQCGRNSVGHNQADLGGFILEALGQRWAVDLGADDYNLPGFFGRQRYDYYSNRAEGHNVVLVDPDASPGQDVTAGGTILTFDAGEDQPQAMADLSPAYLSLRRYTRRVSLPNRGSAEIEDRIEAVRPVELWWFMHTRAQVSLDADGRAATLEQGGRRLRAVMQWPEAARFEVMDARPLPTSPDPEGQNPYNGATIVNASSQRLVRVGDLPKYGPPNPDKAVRKLAIHLPQVETATIKVRFEPAG